MGDEIRRPVQYFYQVRDIFNVPRRICAELTVYVKEGRFTLLSPKMMEQCLRPQEFSEFATQPKRKGATQFEIPFLGSDSRKLLSLKFNSDSDLQAVFDALFLIFEAAGILAVTKKKKKAVSIAGDFANYFANSPGITAPDRQFNLTSAKPSQEYCDAPSEADSSESPTSCIVVDNTEDACQAYISWIDGPIAKKSKNTLAESHIVPTRRNSPDIPRNGPDLPYSSGVPAYSFGTIGRTFCAPGSRSIDPISKDEFNNDVFVDDATSSASGRCSRSSSRNTQFSQSAWEFRSFVNLGNSCYMNSVLQILFYSSDIRTRMSRLKAHREFRGNCSKLLAGLFELEQKMSKIKSGSIATDMLQNYLQGPLQNVRYASGICLEKSFGEDHQQDAHEYWQKLMNHIEYIVNNYEKFVGGPDDGRKLSKGPDDTTSIELTDSPRINKLTIPNDLFKVQISNRLGCNNCGTLKESMTEEYYDIQLSIREHSWQPESVTLLLNNFLKLDCVEYKCEVCGLKDFNKTYAVQTFPRYMLLVIKRYGNYQLKKNTYIHVDRDLFLSDIHVDSKMKQEERNIFLAARILQKTNEENEAVASCLGELIKAVSSRTDEMNETVASARVEMNGTMTSGRDEISETMGYSTDYPGRAPWLHLEMCNLSPIKHDVSFEFAVPAEPNDINLELMDVDVDSLPNFNDIELMEVSPMKNRLIGGDFTNVNNNCGDAVQMFSDDMPVLVSDDAVFESEICFKPASKSLLRRIRKELDIQTLCTSDEYSWRESFLPDCELSAEAPESISVKDDGNSLFRSLSWWLLNGDDRSYDKIRFKVAKFMEQFADEFSRLLPEHINMTNYARNMTDDGEPGTSFELHVAATMLKCSVFVYRNNSWQKIEPMFGVVFDREDGQFIKYADEAEKCDVFGYGAIYLSNEDGITYNPAVGRKTPIGNHGLDHPEPVYVYNENDGPVYTLTGVVNHIGDTMTSGHYTAITYDEAAGVWVHCNDSIISVRSEKEVLQEAGQHCYMLIYKKRFEGDTMDFTHVGDYLKEAT